MQKGVCRTCNVELEESGPRSHGGKGHCRRCYQRVRYQGIPKTYKKEQHRLSETPEYKTWCGIKQRCYLVNSPDYASYGGRGIGVCARWRNSFANFLADMGHRPSDKHSIDRIDNNGDYTPDNCRRATWSEQNKNRRKFKRSSQKEIQHAAWVI